MTEHDIKQFHVLNDQLSAFVAGELRLGSLIANIEAVLSLLDDASIKDVVFPHLVALEEMNASMHDEDFDFEAYGKPVVERTIGALQTYVQNLVRKPH